MTALWWSWGISALLIVALGVWAGRAATGQFAGILIDTRGRYSLTRLQISLWTVVVVSLLVGVLVGRATVAGVDPLGFSIPDTLLAALGISLASGLGSITIKAYKNRSRADYVAASPPAAETARPAGDVAVGLGPRLAQLVLVEEGQDADVKVDITKFQNLLFTMFLIGAYVVVTVQAFRGKGPPPAINGPADIATLPDFNATFITLLLISHGAYLIGKLPNRGGQEIAREAVPPDAGRPRYSVSDRVAEHAARRESDRAIARTPAEERLAADSGRLAVEATRVPAPGDAKSGNGAASPDEVHRRLTLLEAEVGQIVEMVNAGPRSAGDETPGVGSGADGASRSRK